MMIVCLMQAEQYIPFDWIFIHNTHRQLSISSKKIPIFPGVFDWDLAALFTFFLLFFFIPLCATRKIYFLVVRRTIALAQICVLRH